LTKFEFRNHFQGLNLLRVDVFDKDLFIDDKIGSVIIDLTNLTEKSIGICPR